MITALHEVFSITLDPEEHAGDYRKTVLVRTEEKLAVKRGENPQFLTELEGATALPHTKTKANVQS